MEQTIHNTKVFKDVFPDYEVFQDFINDSGMLMEGFTMPRLTTFKLIFNEYACSHIAYTEEGFKLHFLNDLYTFCGEFEETTDAIIALRKLTDEELSSAGSTVLNIANIPETESNTNTEEVDFISQQQKTISKKSLLQIKKEQLSNKRILTTRTFLKRFRHLFIRILSNPYTEVWKEKEGD